MTKKQKNKLVLDDQIALSDKTIWLMNYITEHKQETLKNFVAKMYQDDQLKAAASEIDYEESHVIVMRFIILLNTIMEELDQEFNVNDFLQRVMIPSLKNISCEEFESTTIRSSAKKAVIQAKAHHKNLKKTLCCELLKRWKPSKKTKTH